ncbi:SusC/RagA family TonB-linked outer membrane protein [Echinicola pacifica]|uniref:SusC/RagA family TonB-linked outer membrane protein n=2 Tax=Echinicola pacifica TaxID=346377 RepID=A0A918PQ54_9BACT|nr:SusC/RagA family TonB-linked outer membrane protein [Echinicola pacifica]
MQGYAQQATVRGTVLGPDEEPLIGVNVILENTSGGPMVGTITDLDGTYEIKAKKGDVIVFTFIGFKPQRMEVGNSSIIDLTLEEDSMELGKVVVVGYGSQKKESVVGAISTIGSADIVRSPTANLTTGLAGKLPGLTVMLKDGELGSENVQTLIRGQATINNSSPLILVDGVEREISTLDPYDVESVSVLKDASATAVFGVRGANGVILITTKKGLAGEAQITGNLNYSLQSITRVPQPMGAVDYMNTRNAVIEQHNQFTGGNTPPAFSEEVFDAYANGYLPDYYVDRNFYEELMYDYVPMMKANVNVRGGTEKTKYFTSVGYMRQGGPFKTERWDEYNYDNEQRLDRFNYRANIDMQINKGLRGWLNLSGYLQDKNDPIIFGASNDAATTGSFYYLQMAAYADIPAISYPDLNSDGEVVSVPGADRTPYGNLNRTGYRTSTDNTLNTTLGLEQDLDFITKGLSARVMASYDSRASHIRGFNRTYQTYIGELDTSGAQDSLYYLPGAGNDTELNSILTQSFYTNFDLQASLNYQRKFNDHNVTGQFLYLQSQKVINIQVPYNYVGLVGRVTYAYRNRYLSEFNFGMNGSEQFAPGNRFGFFPSFSLGWVASEEDFLKDSQFIDFLKFRGSFGLVGNDKISNTRFIYVDDWTQGSGGYFAGLGGMPGLPAPVYQNSVPNANVSWEVSNKANLGVEVNFLDGFELDMDVFYEKRSSILITNSNIPTYVFGQLSLAPTNNGVMTNKGIEASLGYTNHFPSGFTLSSRLSTSFARNKVISINEASLGDDYAYPIRQEGFRRGTMWGYNALGYFQDQTEIDEWADQTTLGGEVFPGDLKYEDVNGDGLVDPRDQVPMQSPNVPEFNYSASMNASYKGVDFSVLFHGVSNYGFNVTGRGVEDWNGNAFNSYKNYFEHHKGAWTEEKVANGEEIIYPRMHVDGVSVSKQPSNYWIQDLWYIRLRNVELGYTLPESLLSRLRIDNLRVYFNGANVGLWDNMKYKVMDPEVSNSLSHPIFATYNLGLNITL